ncbi:micrococcal nuclease [Methylomarinovum tepidoasis]|uniref:Micrococcal nuclease n=1 Tax=Methylomarinovum tepidoasis TaxID=2840183 RepID=A0AAU9CD68_9GAMM|nr:thermonuclease family protein [Methylomarinovum sp. IN45]BCX88148.1 micrococcal nuclease [Methylomarinovum sp. IN45]
MIRGFLAAVFLFLMTAAAAAVFQWRDSQGNYHFSDRPLAADAAVLQLERRPRYHQVAYIYDGDTVRLADGRKVRLLNINTPEIETERKRGEPGGEAAKRQLETLLEGRRVRLEYDVERHDKYGRTLAYLFRHDGLHVNLQLVALGWAIANIHPPNLKYADAILEAQQQAEQARRGIWGMDAYAPKPIEILRRKRLHGWQRLVGVPKAVKPGRKYVRLSFAADLYVTIPRANLRWFPPLESYLGHRVEVRGWPSRRGRQHSILVRHPSALIVLDR